MTIAILGSGMAEGSTLRMDCVSCGSLNTLTLTLDKGVLLYNCYEARCNYRGAYTIHQDAATRIANMKAKLSNNQAEWVMPEYWVDGVGNNECYEYMKNTHMLEAYATGLFRPMYDPAERRFVFPIKDSTGTIKGAVGRSLEGKYPKVLNYNKHYSIPFNCGKGEVAWIVEDCASAVSVTRLPNTTGIAILGTSLRKDFIPFITTGYKKIVIALDADAYNKSFNIKKRLDTYHSNVVIQRLNMDIKDMDNINSFNTGE